MFSPKLWWIMQFVILLLKSSFQLNFNRAHYYFVTNSVTSNNDVSSDLITLELTETIVAGYEVKWNKFVDETLLHNPALYVHVTRHSQHKLATRERLPWRHRFGAQTMAICPPHGGPFDVITCPSKRSSRNKFVRYRGPISSNGLNANTTKCVVGRSCTFDENPAALESNYSGHPSHHFHVSNPGTTLRHLLAPGINTAGRSVRGLLTRTLLPQLRGAFGKLDHREWVVKIVRGIGSNVCPQFGRLCELVWVGPAWNRPICSCYVRAFRGRHLSAFAVNWRSLRLHASMDSSHISSNVLVT